MKDSPLMLLLPIVVIMGVVVFMFARDVLSPMQEEIASVEEKIVETATSTFEKAEPAMDNKSVHEETISVKMSVSGPVDLMLTDNGGSVLSSKEFPGGDYSYEGKGIEITDAQDLYTIKVTGLEDGQYELRILAVRGNDLLYTTEVVARSEKGKINSYLIDIENNKVSIEDASYLSLLISIPMNDVYESCTENENYYVVSEKLDYRSPVKIYVYKKSSSSEVIGECKLPDYEPSFVMKLDEASYLRQIVGGVLIVDSGTGPSPRGISGINLTSQEKVFSDSYGSSITLYPPESVGYWRPVNDVAPILQNCIEKEEIEKNYLTPSIQQYLIRNLTTGKLEEGDFRCVATQ